MQPTDLWLTPASRTERSSCILVLCADVRKCRDSTTQQQQKVSTFLYINFIGHIVPEENLGKTRASNPLRINGGLTAAAAPLPPPRNGGSD